MARGGARPGAGRKAGKSANTSPVSARARARAARARARARVEAGNQRPWPADKVERWPLTKLIPYARNARTHSDEQVAQIAASIREFGFTNPVLVDEEGTPELLRLELGELKLGGFDLSLTGFGDLELAGIMADRTAGLTDPDDAPAVPEHPVSRTGDLWLLGRHRLLCGDSFNSPSSSRSSSGSHPEPVIAS